MRRKKRKKRKKENHEEKEEWERGRMRKRKNEEEKGKSRKKRSKKRKKEDKEEWGGRGWMMNSDNEEWTTRSMYIPDLFVATRRQDQPNKIFAAISTKRQDLRSQRQYNTTSSFEVFSAVASLPLPTIPVQRPFLYPTGPMDQFSGDSSGTRGQYSSFDMILALS